MKKKTAVAAVLEPEDEDVVDNAAPPSQPVPAGLVRMTRLPADVNEAVTFVAANQAKLLDTAEQILASYAPCFDTTSLPDYRGVRLLFHADELTVFDALNWDGERLRREAGRVKNIIELQRAAGTSADRRAATERMGAAKQALEKRGPELQEEIERLNRELHELEKALKELTGEVERRQLAVERLEEKLPPHVHEQFRRERGYVRMEFRDAIDAVTQELADARKQPESPEMALVIQELMAKLKRLETRRDEGFAEVKQKHLAKYAR